MQTIRISTIALLAALVVSTPAAALSVKVNTPATKAPTATVNVNTGSSKGNTVDAKVNTPANNSKTNVKASVDADDVTSGNDGDNTAAKVSIGNGGSGSDNLKVTGSPLNSSTTKATVSTGSVLPGSTNGLVDDGTTNGSVTLGGSGTDAVDNLFGGTTSGKVNLKIGKTVPLGTSAPVVGKAGAAPSTASVAINSAPTALTNGTTMDPMSGLDFGNVASGAADVNLLQSLFGGTVTLADASPNDGTAGTGTGDDGGGSNTSTDDTASGGGSPRSLARVAGNGDAGSDSSDGGSSDGSTTTAMGTSDTGTGISGGITTGATQVATSDGSIGASCFTPNSSQTRTLLTRHPYNDSDLAYFGTAKSLQVVSVGLCGGSRTEVSAAASASAGVSGLQSFIAKSPSLSGALAKQDHKPGDVVAVDRQGDTLVAYVI